MNLTGSKNIRIVNNDDGDEEKTQIYDEEEHEEKDDDEEDDEPDFMDNSGKFWEFVSKIGDEKHLKEWCHKMGAMIVGREEKLTRQFHCPIEECQFKAIFLKSCSIIYTRNKHNHGMENEKNIRLKIEKKKPQNIDEDYIDHFGNIWKFYKEIGKNVDRGIFHKEFRFSCISTTGIGLNLHCGKKAPYGRCKFAGVYLNSNGCLYTRGKHAHSHIEKDPEPNVGDDYVDRFGNVWKFFKDIGKSVKHEIFSNKFGFGNIQKNQKTLYLKCRKINSAGGKCKFAGIYLKSNGCLYTRGKHEHKHIEKNPIPNVGEDYVDRYGKVWPFHSKIGKQHIPNEIFHNNFGFTTVQRNQRTLYLFCQKYNPSGGKCPFVGIYLKSNGCLYTRGEHEHTKRGKIPQNNGEDYVDHFGNVWPFHSKMTKHDVTNEIWLSKFGFSIRREKHSLYLYCQKGAATKGGRCPIKGVYLNSNGCLYIRGKHGHK